MMDLPEPHDCFCDRCPRPEAERLQRCRAYATNDRDDWYAVAYQPGEHGKKPCLCEPCARVTFEENGQLWLW